jgi:2-methylcitrate dehydratase
MRFFSFRILDIVSDAASFSKLPVDKFTDLFVKP